MAVHQGVGTCYSLTTSATSAQTEPFSHQTNTLKVISLTKLHHVSVGSTPTAATTDYPIETGGVANINLGTPASQRVTKVTKGASTVLTLPQGVIGAPFQIGDRVELTSNLSGWNFKHHNITAITNPGPRDADPRTTITVAFDSSAWSGTWGDDDDGSQQYNGVVRRTFQLAARTASGAGTVYAQQIQITGDA